MLGLTLIGEFSNLIGLRRYETPSFDRIPIVKHVGIDFALVVPTQTGGEVVAIPILGLTVPFGNVPGRLVTK